jgi:hypothetical protein
MELRLACTCCEKAHASQVSDRCLDAGDDRDSQLLVNHEAEDAHHGRTSVVELDGTLLELGRGIKRGPAKVDVVVTEVTGEFSSSNVLHDGTLKEADETKNLGKSGSRNDAKGGESVGDIGERQAKGELTGETKSSLGSQVTSDGNHGDTSVLDLDETKAVEVGRILALDQTQRIVKVEGSLGAELTVVRRRKGGGTRGLLGGSKGDGGREKGGENG